MLGDEGKIEATKEKGNLYVVVHDLGGVAGILCRYYAGGLGIILAEGEDAKEFPLYGESVCQIPKLFITVKGLTVCHDLDLVFSLFSEPLLYLGIEVLKVSVIPQEIDLIDGNKGVGGEVVQIDLFRINLGDKI